MQNSVNEFLTPRVIKVDEKSTTRALVTLEPLERGWAPRYEQLRRLGSAP